MIWSASSSYHSRHHFLTPFDAGWLCFRRSKSWCFFSLQIRRSYVSNNLECGCDFFSAASVSTVGTMVGHSSSVIENTRCNFTIGLVSGENRVHSRSGNDITIPTHTWTNKKKSKLLISQLSGKAKYMIISTHHQTSATNVKEDSIWDSHLSM